VTNAKHPNRAVYCVDWDGTCVEEVWPGMGDWLPGAVEALRELASRGKTVIYSLRLHYFEEDDETPRDVADFHRQRQQMRRMLNDAGLHDIDIYPNTRGKPPAQFYIDDRAVRFDNSRGNGWDRAIWQINVRESAAAQREEDRLAE
jgi:hypothetical protein